ncbi:glycosyltransferase [Cellulosimicrobium cellulans]|uniref:glycosyltransferase n=1 Tax=Cellulosimicrobium cellulans TaxID=1710 RepID=UPI000848ABAA|nr:nucleotide disphospho-sugar-binding domain-containing protein [Cellulosimicrobium cellulans]
MARSYLFALTDGGGTVPPEVGAARRLVERGHRVRVLAEDSMASEVRAAGATFVPWETAPNRRDRDPAHDPLRDWEARGALAQARLIGDRVIAGPAPAIARDVLAAVDAERPDLVVTSVFTVGAMIAAQSRGIPFDVLLPNVYAAPYPGRTPFGAGLRPARGPVGRLRDRAVTSAATRTLDRFTLARLDALRADLGLGPLTHSWEQMGAARQQLVMTSPAFDLPGPLPANARYVGPVLDDPSWADDVPWEAPPGDDPLVLVALSSTFQDQAALLRRVVAALSALPVRGVVTTGQGLDPGAVPVRGVVTTGQGLDPGAVPGSASVSVVAAAPHRAVLRDAALVVTHGGHGTLLKALVAGCPVVVLPHGRDQADNAVRVTLRGAGVAVPRRSSAGRIHRAVHRVLHDPSFARAAARLGDAVRRDAEHGTLVAELEDLDGRAS